MTTITNLLANGDFEGSGWSGGAYDTTHAMYGTQSYKLIGTAGYVESIAVMDDTVPMTAGHTYYVRWMVYHEGATGTTDCYFGIWEPSFIGLQPIGPSGQWNAVSAVNTRPQSGEQGFRFDYNNNGAAGALWIDGAILVDLTATFGSGNEPSKEWCDSNIPFFIGSWELPQEPQLTGVTLTPTLQPNPVECGDTVLVTCQVKSVVSRYYELPASGWAGSGPYEMTIVVANDIIPESECIVYADHTNTLMQRVAEYDAVLRADITQAGRIRFRALSSRPTDTIGVRVITGIFPTLRSVSVPASWWYGDGPWYANVDIGVQVQSATVAAVSGSTDEEAEGVTGSGIHVSDVVGKIVTLRAMLEKPTSTVVVGVMAI